MLRSWIINTGWMLALIAVSGLIYIRIAPLPEETYHLAGPDRPLGTYRTENSFEAVLPVADDPQARLQAWADLVAAAPRARPLAGTVAEGHLSFVIRSRLIGFPDIVNLWLAEDALHIRSASVYGRSDLGVNRDRVQGWLAAIGG